MESVTYWNEECRCLIQLLQCTKTKSRTFYGILRDVELGSLEQTVENQPKFFANSMKVHLDINPPYSLNTLVGPRLIGLSWPDDS